MKPLYIILTILAFLLSCCNGNGSKNGTGYYISKDECFSEKPDTCPKCGNPTVFPVGYGLVDVDDNSLPNRYYLGKCEIEPKDPDWGCNNCDALFWSKDRVTDDYEVISKNSDIDTEE